MNEKPTPDSTDAVPKPGSPVATAKGCTCPVLDNGYGMGRGDGCFYISGDCPIHARPKSPTDASPEGHPTR